MSTHARKRSAEAAQPPTIPAPPSGAPDDGADAGPTTRRVGLREPTGDGDARPTTVPDYDVEALAASSSWDGGFPRAARGNELPLDLAVPVRRRASVDGAPLRAAFLLSHVDDRMSITEIAATAQLPVAEAVESFVLLADLGVVELRGAPRRGSVVLASESAGPASLLAPPSEPARPRPPSPKSGLRPKT
ncbi:MAG: hypothetical protein KF894_14640 [Labilithrix sp.]|nr:hypothetical protein [Labilithrix sp.]